jgi:hypothetical protein
MQTRWFSTRLKLSPNRRNDNMTTEQKTFTPGPWKIDLSTALRTFIESGSANGHEPARKECMKLLPVLAAAPDLLSAAITALDTLSDKYHAEDSPTAVALQAAMDKATKMSTQFRIRATFSATDTRTLRNSTPAEVKRDGYSFPLTLSLSATGYSRRGRPPSRKTHPSPTLRRGLFHHRPMTKKPVKEPTDEALRIGVFRAIEHSTDEQIEAWRRLEKLRKEYRALPRKDSFSGLRLSDEIECAQAACEEEIPDYPHSLDECAEFEKGLTDEEREEYARTLYDDAPINGLIRDGFIQWESVFVIATASARQRCLAFLGVRGEGMSAVFYKLRHVPTGLFFKPSKHCAKANLSKAGKTYNRPPSLASCLCHREYRHPLPKRKDSYREQFEERRVVPTEWEVVKFETKETQNP